MTDLRISRVAEDSAARDLPALVTGGTTLTFAELAAHVAAFRESARLEPGARVAFTAPSSFGVLVGMLAAMDVGATIVPIHPRLTDAERAPLLARSRASIVIGGVDLDPRAAAHAPRAAPPSCSPRPEDPLALVFTSGTSGAPKGAVLSRGAFVAAASASASNIGWLDDDRWLLCMPLAHVGGLSIVTRCLLARRPVILVPKFEAGDVLSAIEDDRASLLSVVPTMLDALLRADRRNALAKLRVVLLGGAAAPRALLEECAARGVRALTTYGLTEACSQVTSQRPKSPSAIEPGSGRALLGVQLLVRGPQGEPCAAGEVGRILVKSQAMMTGYERDEGPPDPARTDDGWFDTGDLGALDATGRLFVHARRDDLIVSGGENVYPVEVEQALEGVGVRRALVFGVPDARWGHVVAAALELDEAVSLEQVAEAVALRLAPHKRPRLFARVATLELTSSGKLVRSRALERYGPLEPLAKPDVAST